MAKTRIAIKVDLDTDAGSRRGAVRISRMLEARGLRASFFFSLGPDNSGRAIFRVLTRPGFLKKMFRTNAPGAYGLRTLLSGTLLPAPIIGDGLAIVVAELSEAGHELGLHAWDHVSWHDRLWKWPPDRVRREVRLGLNAFVRLTGAKPMGFAAPAWRMNAVATDALEKAGLVYTSGLRGDCGPCRPCYHGHSFDMLEIPTSLPTADEILGREGVTPDNLHDFFLKQVDRPGDHVMTIHGELEGRGLADSFERFLDGCLERGVEFIRMIDLAMETLCGCVQVPEVDVVKDEIPGRAGRVSCSRS